MDWRSQWGWTVVGARVLGSKVNPKTMGGRSWDCGGWRERSLGKNSRNCGARASAGPWASRIETAEKEDRCPTGALRRARELNWLGREKHAPGLLGEDGAERGTGRRHVSAPESKLQVLGKEQGGRLKGHRPHLQVRRVRFTGGKALSTESQVSVRATRWGWQWRRFCQCRTTNSRGSRGWGSGAQVGWETEQELTGHCGNSSVGDEGHLG